MVTTAASVDWVTVGTEVEAPQLEFSWIKEFDPRFNVKYRDDKSYPFLAVTLNEEFPRLQVMRGAKRKGVRYFGPYSHAWAIRETLDLLLRVFPARTCSSGVFKRAGQIGRPCLLGYIGKCSAPCVGRVSADEHRAIVDDFCDFMAGRTDTFVKRLEREMMQASEELEFERAARLRDDIAGAAPRDGEADRGARRRHRRRRRGLRRGSARGRGAGLPRPRRPRPRPARLGRGKGRGPTTRRPRAPLLHPGVRRRARRNDVPRELLVPALPPDAEALEKWLTEHRGSRVSLRVATSAATNAP
jgi:excinuclease ABC subunit C